MKSRYINEENRKEVQRKYIDQILGEMDFMQIKDKLRDYLSKEKDKSGNYSLECEIRKETPEVLVDNWEDFDQPATLTKKKSQDSHLSEWYSEGGSGTTFEQDDPSTQEELYHA
jgi:hypothetical protein